LIVAVPGAVLLGRAIAAPAPQENAA
jgi:hypothetical protein